MGFPSVEQLLTPLGDNGRFRALWDFMGIAPGYMMLTGLAEIIGSILLFNKRTVVLGALIELFILINVVGINIFYNIPVKMFSTQLLIYTLFLLSPYVYRLIRLFIFGETVTLSGSHYGFPTSWKKYTLISILIVFPLLIIVPIGLGISERYGRNKLNARRQKIYEVTAFVQKDTLAPLLPDTLRWKRFLYVYSIYSPANYAVIYNMKDEKDYYSCDIDSNKKTYTLRDDPDTLKWHVFHYMTPAKDQLVLTGKWKGRDMRVCMRSVPIDSLKINKEKIMLLQD